MTAAMFAERRHTVVVDAAPGLRVHGDATRLAQVISNLLVNAAKYSDPGKTTTITATRAGPCVEIAVADQGVGLAPEMLPRVFELFTQEERSLARAQGGLGLGLAIVRKLVVLHGGSVRAHSDGDGRGSTFTVTLPALDAGEPREPAPRRAARRSERPRRVLVVDDNVDVADMMAELLGEMGHVVRTAHDGETALEVVPQFAPEVALLDLGLPAMDGLELARKLRAAPGCPFLVAVTGYGRGSDQERAMQAGFDAHLVKPVSVETVLRVIDGVPSP
jgi:CheY-like chemotaxis protein